MAAQIRFGRGKVREGIVVSDKMQKTVVVAVATMTRHPLYKKTIRRLKRYLVHDADEACQVGDRVRIVESRPFSRHKRWRLAEILAKAELPEVAAESIDLELLGETKTEAQEEPAVEAAGPDQPPAEAAGAAETAEVEAAPEAEAAMPETIAAPPAQEPGLEEIGTEEPHLAEDSGEEEL